MPFCVVAVLAGRRVLRESTASAERARPDVVGVLLVTAVFGLLSLGVVQGGEWGWGSARVVGSFAAAAVLAPLLVARALRHPNPVLPVRLFRVRAFSAATAGTLLSVTATAAETSVVCAHDAVPRKARHEGPFTAFSVEGTLDFTLTGVLHDLLATPAEEQVPVFTLSTFDTDWVLVPCGGTASARAAWAAAGHEVEAA